MGERAVLGGILGGAVAVVVLAALAALGYRRLRQRRVARDLRIDGPAPIAEGRFVTAGGIPQWIQIRGADRANPVLLVASGAGLTIEPFTPLLRAWERHFTVVLWDRRDVGRTRGRNGKAGNDEWTFDRLAMDGIEVVEQVCRYLGQDKAILVGFSQGSIVGVSMVRARPDLFHAYVGAGQIADMARNEALSYEMAVDAVRESGNAKAAKALAGLAPPYRDARTWINKQRWSMAVDPEAVDWQRKAPGMVLTWPRYSLADVYRSAIGPLFLPPRLFTETMAATPERLGTRFEVPVFLIHGERDAFTSPALAHEYLAAIDAPVKEFVSLADAGHLALLVQADRFLDELLTCVRPLTLAG